MKKRGGKAVVREERDQFPEKRGKEIPIFPPRRVRAFFSDYVGSYEEAVEVLEEKTEPEEEDSLFPYGRK